MKPRLRCLSLLLGSSILAACSEPRAIGSWHDSPKDVRLVTEDIPRFWQAYDRVTTQTEPAKRASELQTTYLDRGTDGLRAFVKEFALSADALLGAVERNQAFYAHVRAATLALPATSEDALRGALTDWKQLYPNGRFPDIHFVIGNTETAGTVTSAGIVIGAESVARGADDLDASIPNHLIAGDFSRDTLPVVLAHEMAHAQQKYYAGPQTVLFWIVIEGTAEFLCELVTGRIVNEQTRAYAEANAATLWAEFQATKHELGKGRWFVGPAAGRPGGLGYYVGYAIAKSFYERQPDSGRAISEMLNIDDYEGFLEASGYASHFEE